MTFDWLFNWKGEWWLEGYDTFARESYHLPGKYRTKERAEKAGKRYLKQLQRTQPPEASGGQDGIQDQVCVRGPQGQNIRILPDA